MRLSSFLQSKLAVLVVTQFQFMLYSHTFLTLCWPTCFFSFFILFLIWCAVLYAVHISCQTFSLIFKLVTTVWPNYEDKLIWSEFSRYFPTCSVDQTEADRPLSFHNYFPTFLLFFKFHFPAFLNIRLRQRNSNKVLDKTEPTSFHFLNDSVLTYVFHWDVFFFFFSGRGGK